MTALCWRTWEHAKAPKHIRGWSRVSRECDRGELCIRLFLIPQMQIVCRNTWSFRWQWRKRVRVSCLSQRKESTLHFLLWQSGSCSSTKTPSAGILKETPSSVFLFCFTINTNSSIQENVFKTNLIPLQSASQLRLPFTLTSLAFLQGQEVSIMKVLPSL